MVESEVVATSPYRLKRPVLVYCSIDSMWSPRPDLHRALSLTKAVNRFLFFRGKKIGVGSQICTGDLLDVTQVLCSLSDSHVKNWSPARVSRPTCNVLQTCPFTCSVAGQRWSPVSELHRSVRFCGPPPGCSANRTLEPPFRLALTTSCLQNRSCSC